MTGFWSRSLAYLFTSYNGSEQAGCIVRTAWPVNDGIQNQRLCARVRNLLPTQTSPAPRPAKTAKASTETLITVSHMRVAQVTSTSA